MASQENAVDGICPDIMSDVNTVEERKQHMVVAAIDFGTTFTGFAFSLTDNSTSIIMSKWSGENVRTATEKAPTCVLLSPEKKFVAFGYEAEEKYKQILDEDGENGKVGQECKSKSYYFFDRFKMKLYQTKKLQKGTEIPDIHGKCLPAMHIFAVVISHLKDKIHEQLKSHYAGLQEEDILWVITVPAIWSDSAKQFMREAAKQAGLADNCIKLILEPEAASLYCNTQKLCKLAKLDGSLGVETFPGGQKYIVADLGGGTADLSVHEILSGRNLKEIHRADGDAYGAILVDHEFMPFLENVFGKRILKHVRDNYSNIMMDLLLDFETKKRNFTPETSEIRIKIPKGTLKDIAEELKDGTIDEKMRNAREIYGSGNLKLQADKLCISKGVMEKFFVKARHGIVTFIKRMREDDQLGEINTLLMVGGFSESKYVQHVIKRDIPGVRVLVPVETSLAVLKGAVIAGHNPKTITERIAKYSYGFSFAQPFLQGVHPEELKVIKEGKEMCSSVFVKKITKGEVLKVGDRFGTPAKHVCTDSDTFRRYMPITADVYKSDDKDPKYANDKYGCSRVGFVVIPPPAKGWPPFSLIVQELIVGEAEFTVRAYNINTNKVIQGQIDFLTTN
ncbi:heat shock 70 kDa protein 12A-like [Mercenaria mercenaria]|uniref:heat shock 70 kDa protein 12A-like n=1 Tax=Mercenaria mercenaria TaxID=6596 RepID=UPI00234F0389|nr:heat shock 70 kDa protein 12A-like [Mercenaria mercenaria]